MNFTIKSNKEQEQKNTLVSLSFIPFTHTYQNLQTIYQRKDNIYME